MNNEDLINDYPNPLWIYPPIVTNSKSTTSDETRKFKEKKIKIDRYTGDEKTK